MVSAVSESLPADRPAENNDRHGYAQPTLAQYETLRAELDRAREQLAVEARVTREQIAAYVDANAALHSELRELRDGNYRLLAQRQAVLDLHHSESNGVRCACCRFGWPCATAAALGVGAGSTKGNDDGH